MRICATWAISCLVTILHTSSRVRLLPRGSVTVPFPLALAPAVQEVDSPAADAGEVLDRLLQRAVEVLVVAGVDGRPHVGRGEPVQMSVSQQPVNLGTGIEEVEDQAPSVGKAGPWR